MHTLDRIPFVIDIGDGGGGLEVAGNRRDQWPVYDNGTHNPDP